jgi:FkbM family methyltransferase
MPDFLAAMRRAGMPIRGVVHVGANRGDEVDDYAAAGATNVVWVEALPDLCTRLRRRTARHPGHHVLEALCGAKDGERVTFHVATNDGQSSSMLEMEDSTTLFPYISYSHAIELTTQRLDSAMQGAGFAFDTFNAACLDVQGVELDVLVGASALLPHLDCIQAEVGEVPIYKNGTHVAQLGAFLAMQGFIVVEYLIGGHEYGDAVFMRRSALKRSAGLQLF